MGELRVLCGTRCLKISEISPDFFAVHEAVEKVDSLVKRLYFILIIISIFYSTTPPPPSKISSSNPKELSFEASGTFRSHQETFIQVRIVFSSAELRLTRLMTVKTMSLTLDVQKDLIVSLSQYQKSSSLELYLVNPCGAEQESLIVLLADNPFARRVAPPLDNSDDRVRMHFSHL
ncbi:hypothetical protein E3N88_27879 [Mikania micrantha]|uniref:Uncharacterized protein n=1 Tax=Mikania micrantha TaxID=192012 RepID=A0A5N6MY00_9ASTR|nr:hypothetical protein E3N88_27879 [Mikania micrantha]